MSSSFFDDNDVVSDPVESSSSFFDKEDVQEDPSEFAGISEAKDISQGESAVRGLEQGATFGFADELGGAMGAAMEGVANKPMEGESKVNQLKRVYDEYREFNRKRYSDAEEANPKSFMAADMAGGLLLPGGAAKAGAKLGAKQIAKQAVKAGAATGALESAGRTEEELLSAQGATDVALGTAGGAALGKLLGKIGSGRSKEALESTKGVLEKDANVAAFKSIGARAKDFKDELGLKTNKRATADSYKGTGKTLLDEGVIKPRQSIEGVKESIVDKLDEVAKDRMSPAAKGIDDIIKESPVEEFAPAFNKFTDDIDNSLIDNIKSAKYAQEGDQSMYSSMSNTMKVVVEDVENALSSPQKVESLVDIKRQLQKKVNWNDPASEGYNSFLMDLQGKVSGVIDDISEKASPELAKQMKSANKTYSNLLRANDVSGTELSKDMASEGGLGFRDYLASGVISAATDVPMLGPAVIGGKKVIEKVTGKDTGKLLNTLEAFHKNKKALKLGDRIDSMDNPLSQKVSDSFSDAMDSGGNVVTGALRGTKDVIGDVVGAGVDAAANNAEKLTRAVSTTVDDQKNQDPVSRNKEIGSFIESADPETISNASSKVREEYGEDGTMLANTLDQISQKDMFGRRALIFSLMQDPNNRRMLGIGKKEE